MAVAELGNKGFAMICGIAKLFCSVPDPWSEGS